MTPGRPRHPAGLYAESGFNQFPGFLEARFRTAISIDRENLDLSRGAIQAWSNPIIRSVEEAHPIHWQRAEV